MSEYIIAGPKGVGIFASTRNLRSGVNAVFQFLKSVERVSQSCRAVEGVVVGVGSWSV